VRDRLKNRNSRHGIDAYDDDMPQALAMDYVVSTVHMQGYSRMFRPANFAPSEADHEAVKARGREVFEKGLQVMNKALDHHDYLVGDFSIADAAMFYVEFWADRSKITLPPNCAAHYSRMKARQSEGVSRRGTVVGLSLS
jgi:glutathione S-transferase